MTIIYHGRGYAMARVFCIGVNTSHEFLIFCLGAAFMYSYLTGIRSKTLLQQMAQARAKTNIYETP